MRASYVAVAWVCVAFRAACVKFTDTPWECVTSRLGWRSRLGGRLREKNAKIIAFKGWILGVLGAGETPGEETASRTLFNGG